MCENWYKSLNICSFTKFLLLPQMEYTLFLKRASVSACPWALKTLDFAVFQTNIADFNVQTYTILCKIMLIN